jgi:hypothetical protein
MAHPSKKETHNYSNEGGDKNPPHRKIDSSHKLPMMKKRKNIVGKAKEPETESENMQLETVVDDVFCKVDQPVDTMHHSSTMEIAEADIFYEDESFVFQSVVFDSQSKNLIIEKRDVTNKKGKYRLEINLRNMQTSQISRLHRATAYALDDSIGGIEVENSRLNDRIKELEEALIPTLLFAIPLAKTVPAHP